MFAGVRGSAGAGARIAASRPAGGSSGRSDPVQHDQLRPVGQELEGLEQDQLSNIV